MRVFGDGERWACPRHEMAGLRHALASLPLMSSGSCRQDALTDLFIRAAELAQGLADDAFARWGEDRDDGVVPLGHALVRALARLLLRLPADDQRAQEGGAPSMDSHAIAHIFDQLEAGPLPPQVCCRRQEGFAFYGVRPESYGAAVAAIGVPVGAVIGLRSIGLALGAVAAEASGAPLFVFVRPVGPPFRRDIRLGRDLARRLAAVRGAIAIADEGPGLSGSSLAAVARALMALGVGAERLHLLPSHAGAPGPEADDAIRATWQAVRRHPASSAPPAGPELAERFPDLTGPLSAPTQDLGGGRWRGLVGQEAPALPRAERAKVLLRGQQGDFLVRFAGLGPYGAAVAARARRLTHAGWVPPVLALRGGFLLERWVPVDRGVPCAPAARRAFVAQVAAYLTFRHHAFPAPHGAGADLEALAEMLIHNSAEAIGRALPAPAWQAAARGLAMRVRAVETDNRLHAWEWLRPPAGLLKADAVDHCAAHDLVGCQDVAWDVAGAQVELALDDEELDLLQGEMHRAGVAVDPALLGFLRPCYLAFQAGLWREGAAHDGAMAHTPAARLAQAYATRLAHALEALAGHPPAV